MASAVGPVGQRLAGIGIRPEHPPGVQGLPLRCRVHYSAVAHGVDEVKAELLLAAWNEN